MKTTHYFLKTTLLIHLLSTIPTIQSTHASEKLFETVKIPGWNSSDKSESYDQHSLFKAINGAAEAYLAYGFQQLRIHDLVRDEYRISLNIFDMGKAIQAFGIFQREIPPGSKKIEGLEPSAALPPYLCAAWKDQYFIKLEALKGNLTETLCKEILFPLTTSIPEKDKIEILLDTLPRENRMNESIRYTPKGYLGLSELKNCLHATYKLDNQKEYQIFIVVPLEESTPDGIWKSVSEKWTKSSSEPNIFSRKVPYTGKVYLMRTKQKMLGIVGELDETQANMLLGKHRLKDSS